MNKIILFLRRKIYLAYYFALFFYFFHKPKFIDFYAEYLYIKKNQFKPIKYNTAIQKIRLFNLLNFAIKNVPYYRKIAKQENIKISKHTIFEDIKRFPILTKDILRKNWKDLHTDLKKIKFKIDTSGGTTGEPIKIIQDDNYFVKNISFHLISNEIGGHFMGEKLLMLWGDEKEIIKQSKGFKKYFINKFITNIHFQNAFKMSDDIMLNYVKEINLIKPKVIFSYVQSIYELAKFIKRKNIKIPPIHSIIATAGVLNDEIRQFIEDVFNCTVYNRYGSREVSVIATSCENSYKLHINIYQQYIEILDENNNSLKEHQTGNIIITNCINYGMPLIRYKIGDRGSLDYSQCSCGRGLIRLEKVIGRVVDVFKTKKGELIDGEYFTHLFYFKENIKQFQIVQEKIDEININLVTFDRHQLNKSIESNLIDKIKIVMGNDCKINFNYVNEINPSSSGKIRYTISKIN